MGIAQWPVPAQGHRRMVRKVGILPEKQQYARQAPGERAYHFLPTTSTYHLVMIVAMKLSIYLRLLAW